MQRPLVIIHGWSDESESFIPLAKHLQATLNTQPFIIKLGDWISRQDDVSFPDLVEALDDQKIHASNQSHKTTFNARPSQFRFTPGSQRTHFHWPRA